jgi:hypothetical protein
MTNKEYLFIFFSIFIGFIISYFYIKEFNETFIILFLLIILLLYIFFYYLGNIENKEKFSNTIIRDSIKDIDEETNYIQKNNCPCPIPSEESSYIIHKEIHNSVEEEKYHIPVEENIPQNIPQNIIFKENLPQEEEENVLSYVDTEYSELNNLKIPNYLSNNENTPDLNNYILKNPIPFNINISYNAQNSVNKINNKNEEPELSSTTPSKTPSKTPSNTPSNAPFNAPCNSQQTFQTKNLGNNSDGRIYNNSDWIYGDFAWTNNPDYYIPINDIKIAQPLNELINTKKYRNNNMVSPVILNTPWSEYKSGDSNLGLI